jgi:hypothetical protein
VIFEIEFSCELAFYGQVLLYLYFREFYAALTQISLLARAFAAAAVSIKSLFEMEYLNQKLGNPVEGRPGTRVAGPAAAFQKNASDQEKIRK